MHSHLVVEYIIAITITHTPCGQWPDGISPKMYFICIWYPNYAQNWSKVIDYEFTKYANYSKSIIDTKKKNIQQTQS